MNHPLSHRGYTFLEVIVVIVVIGMVAAGLSSAMVTSLQNPTLNREVAQATFVAQQTLDTILTDRRSGDPAKGYDNTTTAFATTILAGKVFTPTVTVSAQGAGSNGCPAGADCKLVEVSVVAPGGATIEAATLLIDYE
ncbi:MAG: prepilin-type N-terminal cleavage/methylation domain-containing protein [Magnetococcales bacterium]|nr:prepilin-type N-terminal cleavage/methylation domain-containing protein [Magnetococcales bacterium]